MNVQYIHLLLLLLVMAAPCQIAANDFKPAGAAPVKFGLEPKITQDTNSGYTIVKPGEKSEIERRQERKRQEQEQELQNRRPVFKDVTSELFSSPPPANRGGAWGDLNNDGYPDLVVDGRIWQNCEGRSFQELTSQSGLPSDGHNPVIADFNGDGLADIFYPTVGLFLGDGSFRFRQGECEALPHCNSEGAAAGDFDGDGWLDLYVSGYEIWDTGQSFPDFILKNHRGSLKVEWVATGADIRRCHGAVSVCDFNQDGYPDVYVGNYRLQPNFLWVNQGQGRFVDQASGLGAAGSERPDIIFQSDSGFPYKSSGHTISTIWGDFNNDAKFDLIVGNFSHPPIWQDRVQYLVNMGPQKNYAFENRSEQANIPWQESYSGAAAGDFDNDSRLDLFLATIYPNDQGMLFHNRGKRGFAQVKDSGINSRETYQACWADFNRDGLLDLFTGGKLYMNQLESTGNYLKFTLLDPNSPNTMAVGATLILGTGRNLMQIRQVEAGTGCGSQNDSTLHFGLSNAEPPFYAEIRWPDGQKLRLPEISSPNRHITVKRPSKKR